MNRPIFREQVWLTLWAAAAVILVALATGIRPANGREINVSHEWAQAMVVRQVASQRRQERLEQEIVSLRADVRTLLHAIQHDPRRP